jgi:signal peptidase I
VLSLLDGYPDSYESLKRRLEQVNSGFVKSSAGADYTVIKAAKSRPIPMPEARLTLSGGAGEVSHVRLMRDAYYTGVPTKIIPPRMEYDGPLGKFARNLGYRADSARWGVTGNPITLARNEKDPDLDQFFVLGDNSPESLDGRAWILAAPTLRLYDEKHRPVYQLGTVPRYNMIGKAFFVYWPAGFRLPGLPGLSIAPNVGKMRFIH